MKKTDDISLKKIIAALDSFNETEFLFVEHLLNTSRFAKKIVRDFNLSKQEFCDRMKISPRVYDKFLKGAYDYDMMDMARLQAAYTDLSLKKEELRLEESLQVKAVKD